MASSDEKAKGKKSLFALSKKKQKLGLRPLFARSICIAWRCLSPPAPRPPRRSWSCSPSWPSRCVSSSELQKEKRCARGGAMPMNCDEQAFLSLFFFFSTSTSSSPSLSFLPPREPDTHARYPPLSFSLSLSLSLSISSSFSITKTTHSSSNRSRRKPQQRQGQLPLRLVTREQSRSRPPTGPRPPSCPAAPPCRGSWCPTRRGSSTTSPSGGTTRRDTR